MTEKKSYTIYEVQAAECTLEPMKCIHCGHVGEVTYYQDIEDAHCAICGEWQLGETTKIPVTKQTIYDEICHTLTDYENPDDIEGTVDMVDFYELLVKIQNNWEGVITAQD